MNGSHHHHARLGRRAFSLIELLVVISIIALLAAMVVNLAPAAREKKIRGRAEALLKEVEMAIENYKSEKGFYPPDNDKNDTRPPLYYELKGALRLDAQGNEFEVQDGSKQRLTAADLTAAFGGKSGIVNSQEAGTDGEAGQARDFYPTLNSTHVAAEGNIKYVVMPYRGTNGDFNPIIYNVSQPTHNPKTYDLQIVVLIGTKTVTISNWE